MKIVAENLSIHVRGVDIVHQVSCTIPENSLTSIVGPNGSGKSTILHAISRNIINWSGQLTDIDERQLCLLPQNLDPPPFFSILDVVNLGFYGKKLAKNEKLEMTIYLLDKCGVASVQNRSFANASSGEQQRGWLAFALAQSKDVTLLDEPLSSVDLPSRKNLYQLLLNFTRTGKTLVVVTHDIDMALIFSDKIIRLEGGIKVFEGTTAQYQEAYSILS
jgi:iron complex transport system ATP-binding protein